MSWLLVGVLLASFLAGCAPAATPEVIKETVEVTREVPVTVEVTKEVPVTVEVTKEVVKEVPASEAATSSTELKVLNPQGPIQAVNDLPPRLGTLDGKKIALWLSAPPDQLYAGKGGAFYDRLAELLKEQFPTVELISYNDLPMKYSPAGEVIDAIKAAQPDGLIVAPGG